MLPWLHAARCLVAMVRDAPASLQDFKSAIEFLLIGKENGEALELAKEHDMIDNYALFLADQGTQVRPKRGRP